jgi:hypothetical protein
VTPKVPIPDAGGAGVVMTGGIAEVLAPPADIAVTASRAVPTNANTLSAKVLPRITQNA